MEGEKYFKIVGLILGFMIAYFGLTGLVSINIYSESIQKDKGNNTMPYCTLNNTIDLRTFNLTTGIAYLVFSGFCGLLLFGNFVYRKSLEKGRYIVTIFSLCLVWVFMLIWCVFVAGFSFVDNVCTEYNYKVHLNEFAMAMFTLGSSLFLILLGFAFPCVMICKS